MEQILKFHHQEKSGMGMVKVKYKAVAVGTVHNVRMLLHGNIHEIAYKVAAIQGLATFAPQNDEPVVFLKIAERTGSPAPPFLTITLSMLASESKPLSEKDCFYEETDTSHA